MMGAFLTKVAPVKEKDVDDTVVMSTISDKTTPNKFLDPRSPNPFRTPISDLSFNETKPISKAQDLTNINNISTLTAVTPTKLKNRLLRDLGYTLDPRSPALNFDRTPINFNDSNISDDFSLAGLSLNESDLETPIKKNQIENFYTPVLENVQFSESQIDPRSPSIDIERTPLNLNVLLEETQEELNLQSDVEEEADTPTKEKPIAAVITETVKSMIYMDENQEQPMTPTTKADNIEKVGKIRTPLSCLINAQGTDNRFDKRMKMQNKPSLARTIFKDTAPPANHNTGKITNSSSKIPVFRKSLSKEIN